MNVHAGQDMNANLPHYEHGSESFIFSKKSAKKRDLGVSIVKIIAELIGIPFTI